MEKSFTLMAKDLNAGFDDFWYTNVNKTKIWYGECNKYTFMAKNFPTQEILTLNKY